MSEDREKRIGEAEAQDDAEVEGHGLQPAAAEEAGRHIGATEEGPDVEAHRMIGKTIPGKAVN